MTDKINSIDRFFEAQSINKSGRPFAWVTAVLI